jgi:ABC-type transport system involved in multi-copper enzyme maturation permease subunit
VTANSTSILGRLRGCPWRLWTTQFTTIVRIELRKNLFTARGIWVYLLAFAPVAPIALHAMFDRRVNIQEETQVMAGIFQFYYLRLAIFFGCMGIFTRLFRGEMIERSLHYYLLAPVRRELLVVAKFASGAITAALVFGTAVFAAFVLMYGNLGPVAFEYVFGQGQTQLQAYVGIAMLACIAYGALFLALSMVFKNPTVPGVVVLGWEAINPLLPATIQKLSFIFYLRHLAPVQVKAEGVFALLTVVTEPVAAWAAVLGILSLTAAILVFACYRVRRLEISYTTD